MERTSFYDTDLTDEDCDENEKHDTKIWKLLIIQHEIKVSRQAVLDFCKAFSDDDVKANLLEMKWLQFCKNVVDFYKLAISTKVFVQYDKEQVYIYVADFDNDLTQIIALEGLPSTQTNDYGQLKFGCELVVMDNRSNAILTIFWY